MQTKFLVPVCNPDMSSAIEFGPFANNLALGIACNQWVARAILRYSCFWPISQRTLPNEAAPSANNAVAPVIVVFTNVENRTLSYARQRVLF